MLTREEGRNFETEFDVFLVPGEESHDSDWQN